MRKNLDGTHRYGLLPKTATRLRAIELKADKLMPSAMEQINKHLDYYATK